MKNTMYNKAKRLLDDYKKNKKTDKITGSELIKEITINIGGHKEKTVKPYVQMMIDTGLIIETEEGIIIR